MNNEKSRSNNEVAASQDNQAWEVIEGDLEPKAELKAEIGNVAVNTKVATASEAVPDRVQRLETREPKDVMYEVNGLVFSNRQDAIDYKRAVNE